MWGRGRTGCMIACYMVRSLGLDARKAVAEIRRLRPCSIETADQEQLVYRYERHLRGEDANQTPEATQELYLQSSDGKLTLDSSKPAKSVQFNTNILPPVVDKMEILKI